MANEKEWHWSSSEGGKQPWEFVEKMYVYRFDICSDSHWPWNVIKNLRNVKLNLYEPKFITLLYFSGGIGVSKQRFRRCRETMLKQQSSARVILLYFKLPSVPVRVFFFLLWSVCSLEGIPVPLVRQKCRVEQNLHSAFMVCVGHPICTRLEQIRPAA